MSKRLRAQLKTASEGIKKLDVKQCSYFVTHNDSTSLYGDAKPATLGASRHKAFLPFGITGKFIP